jgi:ABC-type enterochelin transport system permease subunit
MVTSGGLILPVFGTLSTFQMFSELRLFLKLRKQALPKNTWLKRHIGMMMGAYIATFTAFVVVNINDFQPAWVPWLLPTFFGVPISIYFTRKFTPTKKLNLSKP